QARDVVAARPRVRTLGDPAPGGDRAGGEGSVAPPARERGPLLIDDVIGAPVPGERALGPAARAPHEPAALVRAKEPVVDPRLGVGRVREGAFELQRGGRAEAASERRQLVPIEAVVL